jgi:hypothetical protein
VTGFAVWQAIAALRKHDIAIGPLLHRADLSERDFAAADADPLHHRISAVRQAEFLDHAAEARNDSAFGFHLAEHTDPRDAGILFYVASGAQSLNEALTLFTRYFRIVNEAVRLTRSPDGLRVEIIFVGLPRHSLRQNAEFGISVLLKALRLIADRNVRPSRAAFAHARNSNLREFGRSAPTI